jgi:hypothetical protein
MGSMLRSSISFAKGAALGATAAYLFDPDRGRARRARVRDQLAAVGRRGARTAGRRVRYQAGRMKGRTLRSVGGGRFEPIDDHAITEHLHGVLSRLPVTTSSLTVEVVGGAVRVRGELAEPADRQVVMTALQGAPGVVRLEDLTHLPGDVAPNKADGIAASKRASRGKAAG